MRDKKNREKKSKLSECLKNKNRAGDIKDVDFGRKQKKNQKRSETMKDKKKPRKKNPSFHSV